MERRIRLNRPSQLKFETPEQIEKKLEQIQIKRETVCFIIYVAPHFNSLPDGIQIS